MKELYVVNCCRTAVGSFGGSLKNTPAAQLGSIVVKEALKRELKGREAEVLKRDFPLAAEELMRRLGLHAGAGLRLAFTKIGNDFWVIRLK